MSKTENQNSMLCVDSDHSFKRAKERGGLSYKKAKRMIKLAKERGIRSENCHWSEDKKYLERRNNDRAEALAYNGFCFIMKRKSNECITMYPLPRYFGKKKIYINKDKLYDSYDGDIEYY